MGTRQETIPTPRPATTRPTTKRGRAVAATWKATPIEKTKAPKIKPNLGELVKFSDAGVLLSSDHVTDRVGKESAEKGTGREN